MEARETTVPPHRSQPEVSATAAAIAIVGGVGVFVASAILSYWANRSDLTAAVIVSSIGLWASIVSIYLVAPLLGVVAITGVLRNEDLIARGEIDADAAGVRKASDRLLIASALLVLVTLLPIALRIAHQWLALWFIVLALLGVHMGRVSRRLARTIGLGWPRHGVLLVGVVVLVLVVVALGSTGISPCLLQKIDDITRTRTFSDSTEGLAQTVVVPTLDTPCPPGRNVIWCSSFQLAWNEIRDTVIRAPLEVPAAADVAARLNAAKESVADLDTNSVYAAGGWVHEGIRERIRREMAAEFPSHEVPDFNDYNSGILAYSYLTVQVSFKHPFRQVHDGLMFTDSHGNETKVGGFGLWRAYLRRYKDAREQMEILYAQRDANDSGELTECALDLCRHSKPYQVVVANIEPKGSLAETLEYLHTRMASFEKPPYYGEDRRFGANDELRIPEMFWRIDHRFRELIGKVVANSAPPMPIVEALQTIEFRLDRSGVVLESDSRMAVASAPRYFEFNRPFLVYVKKRDAERPFFVMWVDNAELLVRR